MGIGPKPGELIKVKCISKTSRVATFSGKEVSDKETVNLFFVGDTSYFSVGTMYAVDFNPLQPE